jgi:hypothetical protein
MSQFIIPDSDSLSLLPLPTQTIGEAKLDDLPVLTEVVTDADTQQPRVLSPEEIQQLLHQLEAYIETKFTQKLGFHLEQLQRQAINHALDELKAELPELLLNAVNALIESR